MARSRRVLIFIFLLFMVAALGIAKQQVSAQSENARYFHETGHWVTGDFLVKYESNPQPTLLYGAPITEAFIDASGIKVQYFEKVRFELDPTLPTNIQVKLSPLGEYLYEDGIKLNIVPNSQACRIFTQTGYAVCYAFLDFFNANGGINQFGYPLSNYEVHDGRYVQYFQKASFEWHPENPPGQWVTMGDLGVRYFYHQKEDLKLLNPILDGNIPDTSVLKLRPRAFVSASVLPSGEIQTIFVIVQDQNLQPVPGAQVEFNLTLPDGSKPREYVPKKTNTAGISMLDFEVESTSPGIATIEIVVSYNGLKGQTRTSFHIWW